MPICYPYSPENNAPYNLPSITTQKGSSLVLALFIIIILSLLGNVLMRMISTSSETVSQEVLGTWAYMAENSAMQAELQLLFPINTTSSTSCDTAFTNKPYDLQKNFNEDIPGLYDCRAETSCEHYYTDLDSTKYYRLTSTGEYGSRVMSANSKDIVVSSRTLQVEARSL